MSKLVFNRDGGKTDEFGHLLGLSRFLMGDIIDGLAVSANGSPNMTVNVATGSAGIGVGSAGTAYKYFVGLDAIESVAITTANPSNPRNDLIVMYVDVAVTPSQSFTNNSNNMLKLVAVAGTPAASPADPSVANIQAAIGAANPYIILARVVVGAGVTQINSGNITDLRAICVPRRVDSTSFLDGAIPTNKLAAKASTAVKIDFTTSVAFADQPSWSVPTLTNGWVNFGGGFHTASYYKDLLGIVHIRGLIKSGSLSQAMFTLPVGYRPSNTIGFPSNTDTGIGNLQVLPTGVVQSVSGGTGFIYLDSVQFRAEA